MKLRQIIRAHKPNKLRLGIHFHQLTKRFSGVSRPQMRLDPRHLDLRVLHDLFRGRNAICQWRRRVLFQRIAGRHHPPNLVQTKPRQSSLGD